jgi:hypothetical protein
MRKRSLIVLVVAALAPIGFATPASADIPSGTTLPTCGFPIRVDDVKNNRSETTTVLPDGTKVVRTTGQLIQRLTNTDTNKSIVESLSGPTTETTSPDGTAVTDEGIGRNLWGFGPNGQRNTGQPGVVVTSGKIKITVKVNTSTGVGTAQTFQLNGTTENICQVLGS